MLKSALNYDSNSQYAIFFLEVKLAHVSLIELCQYELALQSRLNLIMYNWLLTYCL